MVKRIIVFVFHEEENNKGLSEQKTWLLSCSYPLAVIEKGFLTISCRDLRLKILPASTHDSSFNLKIISIRANSLNNLKDNNLKKDFDNGEVIHTLKQPKKLLPWLNKEKVQNFMSEKYSLFSHCNLSYITECSGFIISYEYNWKIRCHINCHSINILYFLSCNSSLRKKCPYLEFFWFVFCRIWTKYGEIQSIMIKMKLLCYESHLHKMGYDTMNC